jgi:phosphoenolpyruvate synthase/pyruvate phosphate dikinase
MRPRAAQVPDGFATTAEAFRDFLAENALDTKIADVLKDLDVRDTKARRTRAQQRALRLHARAVMRSADAICDCLHAASCVSATFRC